MGRWHLLLAFVSLLALKASSSLTFIDPRSSFAKFEKWDASSQGRLCFRFKTHLADCLLLYQVGKGRVNVLEIDLSRGKLHFSFSSGIGSTVVEIEERLNDIKWHEVVLERINKRMVNISLDGKLKKTMQIQADSLKTATSLYIGGLPRTDPLTSPYKNRFIGCIEDLAFWQDSQGVLKNATLVDSKGLITGCVDLCEKGRTCQNGGKCLNKFTTAECNCRHTAYDGSLCQHEAPLVNLQAMDYVIYQKSPVTTRQDRVTFRFRTSKSNGVVLETSFSRDFLVIELVSGSVHVTWSLGAGDFRLSTAGNRTYHDNAWHVVDIQRELRLISVTVDDGPLVSENFPGRFVGFDMKGGEGKIFIGGKNSAGNNKLTENKGNFEGCLQKFSINGVDVLRGVKTRAKGFSVRGKIRWTCARTVATETTSPSRRRVHNYPSAKSQVNGMNKLKVRPSNPNKVGSLLDLVDTPCSVDDDDCVSGGESGLGSGDESSGDSSGEESGSSPTTAAVKPERSTLQPSGSTGATEKDLPTVEGSSPTGCPSDDVDCEGSGGESGSGWESKTTSLPPPQTSPSVTQDVLAPGKRGLRKKNMVPVIAGIAVVSFLLLVFLVFVLYWCHKNRGTAKALVSSS